ncbi:MAG: divalent cation tolerance protein CutA [Candidatus Peribacteria bacterium]|nr:MAG: divalent cation tolerance protein CutA [Candidatus Peribacteria bacterium]
MHPTRQLCKILLYPRRRYQKDEEKLLIIKTTVDLKEKLANFLIQQHPYQVPELIWINPDEVDEKYLSYLNS